MAPRPRKTRLPFTPEEDRKLLDLEIQGLSWKDIRLAVPDRCEGTLRIRHSSISQGKASKTRERSLEEIRQQRGGEADLGSRREAGDSSPVVGIRSHMSLERSGLV